jgi:hypothetical protein
LSFFILTQNKTFQGYLRDRLDFIQEIAILSLEEPDNGLNLAIFNADWVVINDHQSEIPGNFYYTQKLSHVHLICEQVIYPLIFWTGSGGCGTMESEQYQGCTTLLQEVLISLLLQSWDHFIHQVISFREEFV